MATNYNGGLNMDASVLRPGSVRFDETAGRAIYRYDPINSREQLIYGDTGHRNILADSGWIAALTSAGVVDFNAGNLVRLRRIGYECELFMALDKAASGSATMAASFPLGFRPVGPFTALGANSGFVIVRAYHGGGTTGLNWNTTAAAAAASITFRYTTTDPWPTTLPGTAIGTIPNT